VPRDSALGHLVPCHGTEVSFPSAKPLSTVIREQFWGRAVRASRDSQESGALLNFCGNQVALSHGLTSHTTDCLAEPDSLNQKDHAHAGDALDSEPG
jgi:hypothetical protein